MPHHQRGSRQWLPARPPAGSSTCGSPAGPGVRWDGGFETGNDVTLFYDSLLGKIIVWGPDRAEAIGRMRRALQELVVIGVATNQAFHLRLLADPAFLAGDDRQPVPRPPARPAPADPDAASLVDLAVAVALAEEESRLGRRPTVAEDTGEPSRWLTRARLEGLRQ